MELHYVSVASPGQALNGIRNRVEFGEHDVAEADVRCRFVRSHANLPLAILEAHDIYFYDNADASSPHRVVGEVIHGAWRIHPNALKRVKSVGP